MPDVHKKIMVELLPYNPTTTRAQLSGTGMIDKFREVRSFDDSGTVESAKSYGTALEFPAVIRKSSDKAENKSWLGDLQRTAMAFDVEMADLVLLGYVDTTDDIPFKKGDKIASTKDYEGTTLRSYDDLFVIEVQQAAPRLHFGNLRLICDSKKAFA